MTRFKFLLTLTRGRIPQSVLAARMGRPAEWLSRVCSGHVRLTAESAIDLERFTGVRAIDWMIASAEDQIEKAKS